jgi:hypothetical protein
MNVEVVDCIGFNLALVQADFRFPSTKWALLRHFLTPQGGYYYLKYLY